MAKNDVGVGANTYTYTYAPALAEAPLPYLFGTDGHAHYASLAAFANLLTPEKPVHGLRPHVIGAAAKWFVKNFPGDVMYAVKCNPEPVVLRQLHKAGIRTFDVASLEEVETVARLLPQAELFFMHPVKSRGAIKTAYTDYNVRDFSLDTEEELEKILQATGHAQDLGLHIRMSLPKGDAFHALASKFGADFDVAVRLLKRARKVAVRVGLCFHVGSQTMSPQPYRDALKIVKKILRDSKVEIDSLDVGGGYPVIYPDLKPKAMHKYMAALAEGIEKLNLPKHCRILGEPGRALVAEAGSLLVRVDLRKDDTLYINDGVYGSLFDGGITGLKYPVRAIRIKGKFKKGKADFGIYGPTCDSLDRLQGAYRLPADIDEGDYIEIGQIGAYGMALQSRFNGFYAEDLVMLDDQPMLTTPGYWAE